MTRLRSHSILLFLLFCFNEMVSLVSGLSHITTIAGNGLTGLTGYQSEGGPATSTSLYTPTGVWGDSVGSYIYIVDFHQHVVRKVDFVSDIMNTAVGTGTAGNYSDGPATSVSLNNPYGIWGDSMDTYYIADYSNDVVRAVTDGIINTVAGSIKGTTSDGDGGPATSAKVANPYSVWISPDNVLYISDWVDGIRTVDMSSSSERLISRVGGSYGLYCFQVWGNTDNQLYTGSNLMAVVTRFQLDVSPVPTKTVFAGLPGNTSSSLASGQATSTNLNGPVGITADTAGMSYVSELNHNTVRMIDTSGYMTVVVGTGFPGTATAINGDGGPPTSATLRSPFHLCSNGQDLFYIVERDNSKIRKLYDLSHPPTVEPSNTPTVVPTYGPTNQPLYQPSGIPAAQPSNPVPSTVRLEQITTIAGNGLTGYQASGGPATSTALHTPRGIWGDSMGERLYITVAGHNIVRKLEIASDIISIVTGTATAGVGIEGPATASNLNTPLGIWGDSVDTYYIADLGNCVVRAVSDGIITTVVGSVCGPSNGDGLAATAAKVARGQSVWVSPDSVLYIADSDFGVRTVDISVTAHSRVINLIVGTEGFDYRQVWGNTVGRMLLGTAYNHLVKGIPLDVSTPVMTTIAGTGTAADNNNLAPGAATSIDLKTPNAVTADADGVAYVSEHDTFPKVRMIDSAGHMTVVAGTGVASTSATATNGDGGPPTSATLRGPYFLFCDTNSFLHIVDKNNHKIRKLYSPPQPTSSPTHPSSSSQSLPPTEIPTVEPTVHLSVTPTLNPAVPPQSRSPLSQISTIAGSGLTDYQAVSGPATSTSMQYSRAVWGDSTGDDLYITVSGHNVIRMIGSEYSIMTTFAGRGTYTGNSDCPATSVSLADPHGIWGDSMNTLYIADRNSAVVRAVTNGIIRTVAGGTKAATSDGDGLAATSAVVATPHGVWISLNNVLYIADHNHGIRFVNMSVNSARWIHRITGTNDLRSYQVWGKTVNQLLVGTNANNMVKSIQLDGTLTPDMSTFAGTGSSGLNLAAGPATSTNLHNPLGVTADKDGASYVTEFVYHTTRMIDTTGSMVVVVGTGAASAESTAPNGDGGPPTSATLNNPYYVFCDSNGFVYIAEHSNHKIRKLYDQPQPTSSPTYPPSSSQSLPPTEIPTVEPTVQLSVTPTLSPVVPPQSRGPLSQIITIAGNGLTGYQSEASPATSTGLHTPRGIWGDSMGESLYITVSANHIVRKLEILSDTISTVAGTGASGVGTEGAATASKLNTPWGIWGDSGDTYYIADKVNCVVRAVSDGIITTVAGSVCGSSNGDGLAATAAKVARGHSVWVSPDNVLYIADSDFGVRTVDISVTAHSRVINLIVGTEGFDYRQVWRNTVGRMLLGTAYKHLVKGIPLDVSTPVMTTIAGTGTAADNNNLAPGAATSIDLKTPNAVTADVDGVAYVSEHDTFLKVRMIDSAGHMTVVVGTGVESTSATATNGDGGPPTSATLRGPYFLFCDTNSFLYVVDKSNHKIRKLYDPSPTSQPSAQPTQPTSQPSPDPSQQPTGQPTTQPTGRPTSRPSMQPSCSPSSTPSCQPSSSPSSTPSMQPSCSPSSTPSMQSSSSPSRIPSMQPSSNPSCIPSSQPSSNPSSRPLMVPSSNPSCTPSSQPSSNPSSTPSMQPSSSPSSIPSMQPSSSPSSQPSMQPSSNPSSTPSMQPSSSPSSTPSSQPSCSPSSTPSRQPSSNPSCTPSSQPSSNPSSRPSMQPSSNPSSTPSSQPSSNPSCTPSCQPSSNPSCTPSRQPSGVPSVRPAALPTQPPSVTPSCNPSRHSLIQPSGAPTVQPSSKPISQPSSQPSRVPSVAPSGRPSSQPSSQPSGIPSAQPSSNPSSQPFSQPSGVPSVQPSSSPSSQPSSQPRGIHSVQPSSSPSNQPSSQPSGVPSVQPSSSPSSQPSSQPSCSPSNTPSRQPSSNPSCTPSSQPSSNPSSRPSMQPSSNPSSTPSSQPSSNPSCTPSSQPSSNPSSTPSRQPSGVPSVRPAALPTQPPSVTPSSNPSRHSFIQPSGAPPVQPSSKPISQPSSQPSGVPSVQPSSSPSSQPSSQPSGIHSVQPSSSPSSQPSSQPSGVPSVQPSNSPSSQPSSQPSGVPSVQPSSSPSSQPSSKPSGVPSSQPTEQPVSHPSLVPLRANTPTRYPVTLQPTSFDLGIVSVQYQGVSDATQFKMVLPYLFTSHVSGDGLSDITVNSAQNATGYVLLGATHNVNKAISVSELRLSVTALSFDFSGRSVAIAGDVNGDGHIDLIIGVPFSTRVYVLFGTSDGFVGMTEGFTVFGAKSPDLTGWSVDGAGDVNNDGFADIIIGAPAASNVGAAFVLFGGSASGERDIYLSDMYSGGSEGTVIHGAASQDAFGLSVSGAGDVNGDGYDDVIIGALRQGSFSAGATYVLFGNETQSSSVHVNDLYPSQGRVYYGASWSWLGYSVSGAGDVNGDNYTDIIMGSATKRKVAGVPVSYLLFGNETLPRSGPITEAVEAYGVEITGGGVVVAGVGDVSGDHYDDVLVVGDVDLSTGGGMLVQLSVALLPETMSPIQTSTYHPSLLPTLAPSTKPSQKPTVIPTAVPTQTPTRPTAVPTTAPSGPTRKPTMTPTQPTSRPSATPTAPSLKPTTEPTMAPSVASTVNVTNRITHRVPKFIPHSQTVDGNHRTNTHTHDSQSVTISCVPTIVTPDCVPGADNNLQTSYNQHECFVSPQHDIHPVHSERHWCG